ncbi:MAG TPA: M50 family metallopeptidase [Solirubrobacterales bacterium]|jgi:regulator of sigma E protease
MNWVLIFLGFSALIILHEAGHFFAAKATGMRVEKFFLFFGPKLVSFRRGETEYGIATIPAGGFVKITGMNPEEELPPEVAARGYYHQPVWKRIVVIGAGPAVNIAIAIAILFFLFLHYGTHTIHPTVSSVKAGSPAAYVLQKGDELVAVDGKRYADVAEDERPQKFSEAISKHRCAGKQVEGCTAAKPVTLTVRRDGRLVNLSVTPLYDEAAQRPLIGFGFRISHTDFGVGGAAQEAVDETWFVTKGTVSIFSRLFEEEKRKEISGVVGVSDVANEKLNESTAETLLLVAVVSLSLGLINLFPFLPLDGGHIFWSLVEKVRGKPVPFRIMEGAGVIGFALVIMLFFIGLSNDIGRISGGGFSGR